MKFASLCLIAHVARLVYARTCEHGNNCQRALSRTILPSRLPLEDCNSYFRVTVTPATSTLTVTDTATTLQTLVVTSYAVDGIQKRDQWLTNDHHNQVRQAVITASSIPAYASPCPNAAAYSSACSCIGATHATITAPVPLATTTVTATVTSATTSIATRPIPDGKCPEAPSGWSILQVPSDSVEIYHGVGFTYQECCVRCYNTPGCIFWYMTGTGLPCRTISQPGATIAGICPAEITRVQFSSSSLGGVGSGPCGELYES